MVNIACGECWVQWTDRGSEGQGQSVRGSREKTGEGQRERGSREKTREGPSERGSREKTGKKKEEVKTITIDGNT